MATHSSILAWKVPWTEEPGGLHTVHGFTNSWTYLSDLAHTYTLAAGLGVRRSKKETGRAVRDMLQFFREG